MDDSINLARGWNKKVDEDNVNVQYCIFCGLGSPFLSISDSQTTYRRNILPQRQRPPGFAFSFWMPVESQDLPSSTRRRPPPKHQHKRRLFSAPDIVYGCLGVDSFFGWGPNRRVSVLQPLTLFGLHLSVLFQSDGLDLDEPTGLGWFKVADLVHGRFTVIITFHGSVTDRMIGKTSTENKSTNAGTPSQGKKDSGDLCVKRTLHRTTFRSHCYGQR